MKKTTFNFKKRLTQYGTMAAAIAGVSEVSGQIVYTDITDVVGTTGSEYLLDLDGDGTNDYRIKQSVASSSGSSSSSVKIQGYNGNMAVANTPTGGVPLNLNNGDTISSGNYFQMGSMVLAGVINSYYGSSFTFGNFANTTDAYIGLQFDISGATHYGWVRVDVTGTSGFTIKDYAYNSTANEAISAGQTETAGIDNNNINTLKVFTTRKEIFLKNLPAQTSYSIYDITGKQILKGSTSQNNLTLNTNTLNSGIYIIEIKDDVSGQTFKKKILI